MVRQILIPAIVGVSAALLTTVLLRQSGPAVAPPGPEAADRPLASPREEPARVRHTRDPNHEVRLRAVEKGIEELKDAREEDSVQSEVDDDHATENEFRSHVEDRRALFESERPDPKWAPKATDALRLGLQQMAGAGGFEIVDAECRTNTCRGRVRFASLAAARTNAAMLAERPIDNLNCRQISSLEEHDDPSGEVHAELLLDCSPARALETEPN